MLLVKKGNLLRDLREQRQKAMEQRIVALRRSIQKTTELREKLAVRGHQQSNTPRTFSHPGRRLRAGSTPVDGKAFRNSRPIQRILLRNILEIVENTRRLAQDKTDATPTRQLAISLSNLEQALQRTAPTRDREVSYTQWWSQACRSLKEKDFTGAQEALADAYAYFYQHTPQEIAEIMGDAIGVMRIQLAVGREPSLLRKASTALVAVLNGISDFYSPAAKISKTVQDVGKIGIE